MLIGEVMNGIRYKVENILISECSNGGLDTALAAMVAELIHKDVQMMANEYMTKKIAGLSDELDKAKKEAKDGTGKNDCKGAASPESKSPDYQDGGTEDSPRP